MTPVMYLDISGYRPVRGMTGDDSMEFHTFANIVDVAIPQTLTDRQYCDIKECYSDYYNSHRDELVLVGSYAAGAILSIWQSSIVFVADPEPVSKILISAGFLVLGTLVYGSIFYVITDNTFLSSEDILADCINDALVE